MTKTPPRTCSTTTRTSSPARRRSDRSPHQLVSRTPGLRQSRGSFGYHRTVGDSTLPPNLASAERATRRRLPTTSRGSAWRPDPPAERHPRAELDALHPDLVDQAGKQPQPPAAAAEPVGGRWGVVHHGGLDPAAPDPDGHLNRVAA